MKLAFLISLSGIRGDLFWDPSLVHLDDLNDMMIQMTCGLFWSMIYWESFMHEITGWYVLWNRNSIFCICTAHNKAIQTKDCN